MRRIQWVLTLSLLLAGSASYAGISGKIMGRIIDSQTQGPLIGVNIIIEGTTLGAASDAQGNFIIINIPPGTFSVKASMIGYKPVIIQNVQVRVDLTTPVRFEMIPTVLDLGESVIVTAERNMIQMDVTSSQAIISSDEIEEMPVEELEEIIKLQAGVIEGSGGEMHIRGGRSSEISYLIDGIPVTDPFSNTMGVEIENNAIQELQVISGTFNAEYGQAMSGIINIVTKEGKFDKYSGNLSLYLGDYYTRDTDIYYLGDDFQVNGITDLKASFSGPVPIFKDKASFFLSGRYNKDQGYYWGKRIFNPDTWVLDSTHTQWYPDMTNLGDGKDVAMNPSRQLSLQGKVAVRLFPNLKLIASGQGSDTWYQTYSHRYIYNPDGRLHYFGKNFNGIMTLNHTLSS
ncbi:MAG: carboxypeptidase-like regulatory domain-containing protein, partial [Candidatus Marinimicrobia bacterium]|nr:carboxypeptidase-like regulatory domain-containing protein [Candidatus Neomarinimicrobiota bacterium]